MRWHLYKMSLEGAIAVANLVLIGIILAVFMAAFPEGVVYHDRATKAELMLAYILEVALIVLAFPVGWASALLDGGTLPQLTLMLAIVFVPLNAYLWGYVGAAIVRFVRARRGRQNVDGH